MSAFSYLLCSVFSRTLFSFKLLTLFQVYSNGDVSAVAPKEMQHIAQFVALQKRPRARA